MQTDPVLLDHAKQLRSTMTQPERELWTALRARRFAGAKVSRQVVIGPYIADFVARSRKLVIEVDGDTHADSRPDDRRTAWLNDHGYTVIRFGNADIMRNLEGVLTQLADMLAAAPLPNPLPNGERASLFLLARP